MAETTINSHFCRKPCCVQDLDDPQADGLIRVEVVKIIELTGAQYRYFSTHLLEDMPFIIPNKNLTGIDKGLNRCLLITTRKRRDGILVDCQGYNYARYSAYVQNKTVLDLRDVIIDHYNLKLREPRSGQAR